MTESKRGGWKGREWNVDQWQPLTQRTDKGLSGAAAAPDEAKQLLGPDGDPISSESPLTFGFTA